MNKHILLSIFTLTILSNDQNIGLSKKELHTIPVNFLNESERYGIKLLVENKEYLLPPSKDIESKITVPLRYKHLTLWLNPLEDKKFIAGFASNFIAQAIDYQSNNAIEHSRSIFKLEITDPTIHKSDTLNWDSLLKLEQEDKVSITMKFLGSEPKLWYAYLRIYAEFHGQYETDFIQNRDN